jgi:integrase
MRTKSQARRKPIKQQSIGGVTVTMQHCSRPGYAAVVVMRKDGRRAEEKYCRTLADARTKYDEWTSGVGNTGAKAALAVTDADKRMLLEWKEKLAVHGKGPMDAFTHFLAYLEKCKTSITISALCDKFQALKTKEGHSRRYLDDLHYRLAIFSKSFGSRVAADIATEDLSAWLAGLNAAPVTVLNYRRILSVLFSYAMRLKACADNPVDGAFKPSKADTVVGILTVAQAAALLKAAHDRPEILPAIAIGLFAGVRDAELRRLDWSEIGFESGFITITPSKAKKKARRLIELRPALRAWLEPLRQISGPVWPAGERGRILHEAARSAAGITPWPHNALRHSFGSYGLAECQNAAALALEMGNSATVLMEHYREIVLPREAKAYWSLTPEVVLGEPQVIHAATVAGAASRMPTKAAIAA